MKIGIVSDHGGYKLKEKIAKYLSNEYEVINYGTKSDEPVDYPDYAFLLCKNVMENNIDFGIAICKTGIGMSIACNKVKGIRCAKIDNVKEANCAKTHNSANVISLNGTMSFGLVKKILKVYIQSENASEMRHLQRINKIKVYENEH
jgi:ribose 5-phosphate isomerase B